MVKNPERFATVDLHSAEELQGAKCFVGESENADGSGRGTFGAVVRENGDITGVYNGDGHGAGKDAILKAIESGGDRLDAYAVDSAGNPGGLAEIYHGYGFIPVVRVKYVEAEANPNVPKGTDIVFYRHNGDNAETVAANYGKYPPPTKKQYDALPVMEYGAAAKYRDDMMERR
jgi:hypothetical protein